MHKLVLSLAGFLLSLSLYSQVIPIKDLLYLFEHRSDSKAVSQFAYEHAYVTEFIPREDTIVQLGHLHIERSKLYLYKKYGEFYGVGYITEDENEFANWRSALLNRGFQEIRKATFDNVDHILFRRENTLVQVMQEFMSNDQQRYLMNIFDKNRMREDW